MSENYFVGKLNKLEDVQARENGGKLEIFVFKALSSTLSTVNNIVNDSFIWEIRDVKKDGQVTQALYGISHNPTKSNKGARSKTAEKETIEIELI